MFVKKLQQENKALLEAICELQQAGKLLPDSYVVDVDQFTANARAIKEAADKKGIRLFFMLKQIGRNPYLAKLLTELGYDGAVVVDFKEAQVMMRHNIPIGNIGHLVQVPQGMLRQVVEYGPKFMTVYSKEKTRAIGEAAQALGKVQKLLVRVFDTKDMIYSGQTAGISLAELPAFLEEVKDYPGIQIAGVTSFPCYLFDEEKQDLAPTPNLTTVHEGAEILRAHGVEPEILNTPSATCVRTIGMMEQFGGNCGEPGHGLTGTTPAHAIMDLPEKSCIAYVSEVSHNFDGHAYCYGGGHYRRSHLENALVGRTVDQLRDMKVNPPSVESIDYHFELEDPCEIGETVIMAFRFQVFVTRSDMVLLTGVSQGQAQIAGVYSSLGDEKE